MDKLKVGIIFGGRSGEHEVSLMSATSVMNTSTRINTNRFPSALPRKDAG